MYAGPAGNLKKLPSSVTLKQKHSITALTSSTSHRTDTSIHHCTAGRSKCERGRPRAHVGAFPQIRVGVFDFYNQFFEIERRDCVFFGKGTTSRFFLTRAQTPHTYARFVFSQSSHSQKTQSGGRGGDDVAQHPIEREITTGQSAPLSLRPSTWNTTGRRGVVMPHEHSSTAVILMVLFCLFVVPCFWYVVVFSVGFVLSATSRAPFTTSGWRAR